MSKGKSYRLDSSRSRHFSEPVRKLIVEKVKNGSFSVSEASRLWDVSKTSIYNWLKSSGVPHNTRTVVEMDSEGKRLKELEARIAELEQALGRKTLENDYLNKLIDITKEMDGIDVRKKGVTPPSTGSGTTDSSTPTK